MIYKTLHKKLKIKLHEPHKKPGRELGCSGRVGSSCFTSGTHRITLVPNIYMRNSNKYKLKKSLSIVKCMLLYWVNIEQHKYGMTFFLFIFIWISYVDIRTDQSWPISDEAELSPAVWQKWLVLMYGKFEDTKGVIRSRKPKKDIQYNGQVKKDKQRSTKHCTEN